MKHKSPHILLINPWITDFAAYNLWIKPHGLLLIAGLLRKEGFNLTLIDCLGLTTKRKAYEDGNFFKTAMKKPYPLRKVARIYSQYGIPEALFRERLASLDKPDLIGITSGMTYWYPGVFKVIEIARQFFEKTPIILGGIYATLCYEHAQKYSGADMVFKGRNEKELFNIIKQFLNFEFRIPESPPLIDQLPYPAFDLYPHLHYVSILTSQGCPFLCCYCASPVLSGGFKSRDPLRVVEEIGYWTTHHAVKNIAFYDDALLINSSEHIIPILEEVNKQGIQCNFHAPNGLHIREISPELASLLFRCRFRTIRLGLETSNKAIQMETGGKVDNQAFEEAVRNLRRAGYLENEIGVYIMAGLPGQWAGEVDESISYVREKGARPMLVEYSPIPQTSLFEEARKISKLDLQDEPLFHNNSILPCGWKGFTLADLRRLKEKAKL